MPRLSQAPLRHLLWMLLCTPAALHAQTASRPAASPYAAPELRTLLGGGDGLRGVVERYEADLGSTARFHDVPGSPARDRALRQFYGAWLAALEPLDFDKLGPEARIDYVLFRNRLNHLTAELDRERRRWQEMALLLPFAPEILEMLEQRQQLEWIDAPKAASKLVGLTRQVAGLQRLAAEKKAPAATPAVAARASRTVLDLKQRLQGWMKFYDGYDPLFTWWAAQPYTELDKALEAYARDLREKVAGIGPDDRDTIIGDPIGREALISELATEMIPYTPEELIEFGEIEFAWCEAEMRKASRDLGFGDDWRKAMEHVKNLYMPPGQQPKLILDLAVEAIDFVEKNQLVTVPPLARDTWRMTMMTPEQQRVNPFFLGGEAIIVSFPTGGMSHEQKMMSMRGNNIHFARATVFHELIPGHHLQLFMNARHRQYRRLFRTPFWIEGWALHWEMLFWDMGFPKTPENRIGMLFWRSHRAARIVFSLKFHLGQMSAKESVDFLVDRVGHERENAAAEVRRSFETSYAPLYQSAYMLGAFQVRSLHKDLVGSGKMTNRAFHDAILEGGPIPVEMVRARLLGQRIDRNFKPGWRFYTDVRKESK